MDPNGSGDVIDMRHFIVIGKQGELKGLIVEMFQEFAGDPAKGGSGDPASGFDGQDFFSNELGAQFYGSYNSDLSFMDNLKLFFQQRELGSVPTPNQTGYAPSDATRVKIGG